MAEEVIIKFDIGVASNNIARLEAELKKVKQEYKAAEIGSKEFYKAQDAGKQLTEQIKKQNDALKANTNALNGVNASAKFQAGSYGELKQKIKTYREELLKLEVNSEAFKKVVVELAREEAKRIEIEKQIPSLFKERIKDAIDETNTVKALKQQIKEYTSVVLAGGEGSLEASKKLAELKDKLDDVQDATKILKGTGIERLTASMNTLKEAFTNFDADKAKLGFQGIGTAMKAIPIFLILEGIKLLIENFDKIYAFAQSFTAVAKEAKKLQLAHDKLVVATENEIRALGLLEAKQNAQITLMTAEGKGIKEIEEAEKRLTEIKIQSLRVKAVELKSAAMAALAKNKEIEQNETIEMSLYRIVGAISGETNSKAAGIIIAQKKAEAEKESNKIIQESLNGIADITGQIIELNAESTAKTITNNKEIADAARAARREIEQSKIDLIKNDYDRAKEQAIFDANNRKEDLKLNKQFYGDKKTLSENITKLQNEELNKINREQIKYEQDLLNELSQFKIDLIKNDYERNKEQIKLNEKKDLEEAVITYANNAEQFNNVKMAINAKYAEENRMLDLEYVKKDLIAQQELVLETQTSNLTEVFEARQEILRQNFENEMMFFQGTEQEKLLLEKKYANDSIQIEKDKVEAKRQIRDSEIEFAKLTAVALLNVATIFNNGQEQQQALAKTMALVNIAANTATAISGLTAISFSPTNGDNAFNPLGPYIKFAAGIVAITSNIAQAKQVINSFEEGGYTGDGATNEVSTNLGTKPYTYHKSEYVIPARVLATPTGNMLAAQAESMRLGMSNPMPYIGGMFDGGFTARSAGAEANSSISTNAMMQQLLANLPTPVVRVTDINKVQGDSARVIQATSL